MHQGEMGIGTPVAADLFRVVTMLDTQADKGLSNVSALQCGVGYSDDYGDVSYGFGPGGKCVPCKDSKCQECPNFGTCLQVRSSVLLYVQLQL